MDKDQKTDISVYLDSLQRLSEDDLSRDIIKPLFEAMGYSRVDFHGGPYERGKDLIALMRIPPQAKYYVTVIQTKKIGNSQKTADTLKIRTLISQLQQCYTDKFSIISGDSVSADAVFICCPEQMSSRLIEDINGQLRLFQKEVCVLDGPKIIENIKTHKPDLLENLLDFRDKITLKNTSDLKNIELFTALNQREDFDFISCYSDLSFFVGSIKSNILISSEIQITEDNYLLKENDWKHLKKITRTVQESANFSIINENIEKTETAYSSQLKKHNSKENQELSKEIKNTTLGISSLYRSIYKNLDNLKSTTASISMYKSRQKAYGLTETESRDLDLLVSDVNNKIKASENGFQAVKQNEALSKIKQVSSLISKEKNDSSTSYSGLLHDIDSTLTCANKIVSESNHLRSLEDRFINLPFYKATTNKVDINAWWDRAKNKYKENLNIINTKDTKPSTIRNFLRETETTLNILSLLISKKNPIRNSLSLVQLKTAKDRVEISAHQVFDSGYDIAVYGEAGVGKTTTLQMYAREHNSKSEILIYLPLNRLINQYKKPKKPEEMHHRDGVLDLVLINKDLPTTYENKTKLTEILNNEKSFKIILDGLDEAFDKEPDILTKIKSFKESFKNSQIIISSRDCVSYLDNINFLGITLLPFTEEQLVKFIEGWFKDQEKSENLIQTIKDKKTLEIIKTPLLATIVCNLIEKGIDTPSSESAIYKKRLSLLCGEYDTHKKINRQELPQDILEMAAQKLAFELHSRQTRTATEEELISYLDKNHSFTYKKHTCKTAVNELIEKCNVLIKDNISNTISFGHFRFQEHLASLEIKENRNINLATLSAKDWWRGALALYAQTNDIESIIDEIYRAKGSLIESESTLREMISQKPKGNASALKELLEGYLKADKLDMALGLSDLYDEDLTW